MKSHPGIFFTEGAVLCFVCLFGRDILVGGSDAVFAVVFEKKSVIFRFSHNRVDSVGFGFTMFVLK